MNPFKQLGEISFSPYSFLFRSNGLARYRCGSFSKESIRPTEATWPAPFRIGVELSLAAVPLCRQAVGCAVPEQTEFRKCKAPFQRQRKNQTKTAPIR